MPGHRVPNSFATEPSAPLPPTPAVESRPASATKLKSPTHSNWSSSLAAAYTGVRVFRIKSFLCAAYAAVGI